MNASKRLPVVLLSSLICAAAVLPMRGDGLERGFANPPPSARPWVYWMWMDGNLSREGLTADLEAMQRAGIGGVIIMEVDVGIPKGPVKFISPEWRQLFKHAVTEAERLKLQITLNAGPGWTGSGGPWVKPEQSMQHLVASEVEITGPTNFDAKLPQPSPRKPYFGTAGLPPELIKAQSEFYRDVMVLAFPTPKGNGRIPDLDEKALYVREPFSSKPGVKPFLPAPADFPALPEGASIASRGILDLTERLDSDGRLTWAAPPGSWTVVRFGRTSTGANTRPAPAPGLGLESDKFDKAALEAHFEQFVGVLLRELGPRKRKDVGWTSLHIDSWEMGAQNWTASFREEFRRRRGYDPLPYLPAMTGRVVESLEVSERFLWDIRQTAQELVVENHARHLKELGRRHGFGLSIEPYDMNPCADMTLGAVADVPMCEFWASGFETFFTCIEASSIAHTGGKKIVAAEAFTSDDRERWLFHPGHLKSLGDWAFCAGVNRIVFHRYAHQPWLERWPGMTMGPYGVHWERTQTWWEMVPAYHEYLARCQFLLRQGLSVADICFLVPEGAPHVFRPPSSAMPGSPPDRLGYNFDGCAPATLIERMKVKGGRLVLPDGMSYRLLVLPQMETITPALLRKFGELVRAGATVVGSPPRKSPSLSGYPQCDVEIRELVDGLWGGTAPGFSQSWNERRVGKGRLLWGGKFARPPSDAVPSVNPIAGANWIWFPEGNLASAAPVATRYFRRTVVLPEKPTVESASITMTADNGFELWVNGSRVGGGSNFKRLETVDISLQLRPGTNLIAVAAQNAGDSPNPAGLIAALEIRSRSGEIQIVRTDREWQADRTASPGWNAMAASDGEWQAAMELGQFGVSPWGEAGKTSVEPELYPDYGALAELLRGAGVPPDFESDGPLRYTHRRDGNTDIYFVANRSSEPCVAMAAFRVTRKAPELWNPITGEIGRQPVYEVKGGRTMLPLSLEPAESVFVVFRKSAGERVVEVSRNGISILPKRGVSLTTLPVAELSQSVREMELLAWQAGRYELVTSRGRKRMVEVPNLAAVLPLTGPWQVESQSGRGAPDQIELNTLMDLAKHDDAGVRHFSGIANYRLTFASPKVSHSGISTSRIFLELGKVAVMARVKLNGRELRTLWTAPWCVDVTDALLPGDNTLEIRVANLWPNRLIGDAALPADQRVAWTTWNPFKPDAPLPESGLLGPVTLRAVQVLAVNPK